MKPGNTIDADEMKTALRTTLERYKIPKRFTTVDETPRNPNVRVLRHRLIDDNRH